jgi:DNA ligase (NAD+)
MQTVEIRLDGTLARLSASYYEGRPQVSDAEYDRLEAAAKPKRLYGSHRRYTVTHPGPVLSLKKVFLHELPRFLKRSTRWTVEPKVDGGACVLTYRGGELVKAATRGDGEKGGDITRQMMKAPHIPKKINGNKDLDIVGELYCPSGEFQKFSGYADSRCLACGVMHLSAPAGDPRYSAVRFVAHGVFSGDYSSTVDSLKAHGFEVLPRLVSSSPVALTRWAKSQWKNRARLPYAIDGIVFKADRDADRKTLGNGKRFPFWACAVKVFE